MGRTVEELRHSMSKRELSYWLAFSTIEPFGPLTTYYQAGSICSTVVNAMPFRGKDAKTHLPSDFFGVLELPVAEADPEALSQKLDQVLFGGM